MRPHDETHDRTIAAEYTKAVANGSRSPGLDINEPRTIHATITARRIR